MAANAKPELGCNSILNRFQAAGHEYRTGQDRTTQTLAEGKTCEGTLPPCPQRYNPGNHITAFSFPPPFKIGGSRAILAGALQYTSLRPTVLGGKLLSKKTKLHQEIQPLSSVLG